MINFSQVSKEATKNRLMKYFISKLKVYRRIVLKRRIDKNTKNHSVKGGHIIDR